jgi:hypothetical protein
VRCGARPNDLVSAHGVEPVRAQAETSIALK